MIGDAHVVIKAICQDAKRLDDGLARLLDEQKVDALGPLACLAKARVREVVPVATLGRHQVRDVGHARPLGHHHLVRAVVGGAVEVAADQDRREVRRAVAAPLLADGDEQAGAVLAGDDADVVKVRAHDDDAGAARAVRKLANGDDAVQRRVPAARGPARRLAQPPRLAVRALPDGRPVVDGRELAVRLARVAAAADPRPPGPEPRRNVLDLRVEALLQAQKGIVVRLGDEAQLRAQLRAADPPRLLARHGERVGVAHVVRDEPQRHGGGPGVAAGAGLRVDGDVEARVGRNRVVLLLLLLSWRFAADWRDVGKCAGLALVLRRHAGG